MTARGLKGYCKVCQSRWLPDVNRMLDEGLSAAKINDWLAVASKNTFSMNRQTLYAHRDNRGGTHHRDSAPTPKPPSEQATGAAPREPGAPAPKSSNDEFLEFIRDHGMDELRQNPDQITPRMAMEAVKILEARRAPTVHHLVLARVLTNQIAAPAASAPEIVEGEYRELIGTAQPGIAENAEGAKVQ
jgi:hypothetical protein